MSNENEEAYFSRLEISDSNPAARPNGGEVHRFFLGSRWKSVLVSVRDTPKTPPCSVRNSQLHGREKAVCHEAYYLLVLDISVTPFLEHGMRPASLRIVCATHW